jgi:flagellar biosynthetic protein FliQ
MTQEAVLNIASGALWTIIKTSAPLLIISLVVGLIVSIFQTVTSIQEQTLTFIPKILAVFLGLMLFGSFILTNIVEFMTSLWTSFGNYIQ